MASHLVLPQHSIILIQNNTPSSISNIVPICYSYYNAGQSGDYTTHIPIQLIILVELKTDKRDSSLAQFWKSNRVSTHKRAQFLMLSPIENFEL